MDKTSQPSSAVPSSVRSPVEAVHLVLEAANPQDRWAFTALSLDEAEDRLAAWSNMELPPMVADRHAPFIQYEVVFTNGLNFRNKFGFGAMGADFNGSLLREALDNAVRFSAGQLPPSGWTSEQYRETLGRLGQGSFRNANRILAECDLPKVWG